MSRSEPGRADLGRALCVVTGASRGFGRAVARHVARLVQPRSALVLVARSAEQLRALQAELAASEAGRAGLRVECVVADLGEPEAPGGVVRACQQVFSDDMDHVLLVNNAGERSVQVSGAGETDQLSPVLAASLGDVSRYARTFTSRADVDSYMSFNVSSCLCLTAGILQAFPQRAGVKRTVVNVSSLCAQQPFSSWVLYCTSKAARDMMFRVLAAEEPQLRVLSYAPGEEPALSRTGQGPLGWTLDRPWRRFVQMCFCMCVLKHVGSRHLHGSPLFSGSRASGHGDVLHSPGHHS